MDEDIKILEEKLRALDEKLDLRMDALDQRIETHLKSCRELCVQRIHMAQSTGEKAHKRLDTHSEALRCLKEWKNQMTGRMWALSYIISPIIAAIVAVITALLVKVWS